MAQLDPMAIAAAWCDPSTRPLFKGKLIDDNGCCCAQGYVLREAGMSNEELRAMEQTTADKNVARLLDITLFESILLRIVNDSADGLPQNVLTDLPSVIGPRALTVVSFMRHVEGLTKEGWSEVNAAWDAAECAALGPAECAAPVAAGCAAWDAAWDAAGYAAGYAILEIMGADVMRQKGQSFFFLPLFGFATPEDIRIES